MYEPITAGIFGLLGVFVGALLQFLFHRRANQESRYLELKSEVYADYVVGVAAVAFASSPSEHHKALEKVTAAKGRLCVFGDKEVVAASVIFEGTSMDLSNQEAQDAFVGLLQSMRLRGIGVGKIDSSAIRALLLK